MKCTVLQNQQVTECNVLCTEADLVMPLIAIASKLDEVGQTLQNLLKTRLWFQLSAEQVHSSEQLAGQQLAYTSWSLLQR